MGLALMFLLALYHMQSATHSEIIESPAFNMNALNDVASGSAPKPMDHMLLDSMLDNKPEQAEFEFKYPITAIGIDYAKNSVLLRFQKQPPKQRYKYKPEFDIKRQSLKDNFMHFGKRGFEEFPKANSMDQEYLGAGGRWQRSLLGSRDSRADNFMRFGRNSKQDLLHESRSLRTADNFMRFGRNPHEDFMRFGRPDNFMRFGRSDNFMRFGRLPPERLGKMDANFMRFGKSIDMAAALADGTSTSDSNQTKNLHKNAIIEATKILKQNEFGTDESNPVDKAITMLFSKHEKQINDDGDQQQPQPKSGDPDNAHSLDATVEQFYESQ